MLKIILGLICISSSLFGYECKYYLSVCSIFQNDAKYLPEWIEFHQKNGVEHFFLYNNMSTDNYIAYLSPYVEKGLVEIIDWSFDHMSIGRWNTIQCNAYMDCVKKHRNNCEWIAFIDTDEFLFAPDGRDLKTVLLKYKQFSGVAVNWVIYGTSNILSIEEGDTILNKLLYRGKIDQHLNYHVKSIVQPKHVESCSNPHHFYYKHGYCVTEDKQPHDGAISNSVKVQTLRINHYWLRDLEFYWSIKADRQREFGQSELEIESRSHLYNDEYDPIILNAL